MSDERLITRRDLLRSSLGAGVVAAGAGVLGVACKGAPKEFHCDDTTGLPAADVETRKTLGYVDRSADPSKRCDGCQQYIAPPGADSCGACKLFDKTPVHPSGYCKSWVAKSA
jgi:hypothetical protein